jgi:hypothetical protein|tara:strand:- start:348 stop:584 length:237 start_codon:yes stop_codon:yes gene_type:complete
MHVFSLEHKRNIGELDRGVRFLLAIANIALIFAPVIYGFIQIVLIVTATLLSYSVYTGYSYIYEYFGMNSRIKDKPPR